MSAFTGPLSCATHSRTSGTFCCTTSATSTSGGPTCGFSSFFSQAASENNHRAQIAILSSRGTQTAVLELLDTTSSFEVSFVHDGQDGTHAWPLRSRDILYAHTSTC